MDFPWGNPSDILDIGGSSTLTTAVTWIIITTITGPPVFLEIIGITPQVIQGYL